MILGSWSGMRKYLEKEMLADSLKGRVRYSCTSYVGMDGWGIFEVFIDNEPKKQFSAETIASSVYSGGNPVDMDAYWKGYWQQKEAVPMQERDEFDDSEFAASLEAYRTLDIQEALASPNPIVRMFAILDRRVGKRTLAKCADTIERQPEWLRCFYQLRMTAEHIDLLQ